VSRDRARHTGRPPEGAPPLEVRGVTAAYHDKPVLWDVNFEVPEGELVAIVGPNGAGKTTLLKVIMGMMRPAAGRALIYGRPFEKARHWVGYVPQRESVGWDFPTSALDVVTMGLYGRLGWFRRPGRRERATALECLERVGLSEYAGRQIGQLSGGQQQRVFLARALAQEADLYLLDEPLAGVDAATERAVIDVLKSLQAEGRTVVAVHHDLATIVDYFDHVLMINLRKVAEGPVATTFTAENLQQTYGGRLASAHIGQLRLPTAPLTEPPAHA
jgi:manganese/zinc/iron transport system ATP- binding protein